MMTNKTKDLNEIMLVGKLNGKYSGKIVIITGHTGFKGSWLSAWLTLLGARVVGISVDIPTTPSNFVASKVSSFVEDYRVDIRDVNAVSRIIKSHQPDFIFHLAAQALVRPSYESPLETFSINALGSVSVLEALRGAQIDKLVTVVMITSDKAYDNVEWKWGYRETDRLGGRDPYSASKGMAELAIRTYVHSFFNTDSSNIRVGITRAGNVIGGGDWAADRIVPDCINAWSNDEIVNIRSPRATRPWQHVLEPLSGYLLLGAELTQQAALHGEAYNFGPQSNQNYSVNHLIDEMAKYWKKVRWLDVSENHEVLHEAGLLKLNCDKALFDLNWQPALGFEDTVRMTVEWYKVFYQDNAPSMHDHTVNQINEYIKFAKQRGIEWASND
jgi:CDP-glucose 4,6-dehydratase